MSNSPTQSPSGSDPDPNPNPTQYWCYHCDHRVSVDLPSAVCRDCNGGFVEPISFPPTTHRRYQTEDHSVFGNDFLNVLRLISESAHDDHPPPPPPQPADLHDGDYLRVELQGWNNDDVVEDDDVDDDDDDDDDESYNYVNEIFEENVQESGQMLDQVNEYEDGVDEEVDFGIGWRESLSLGDSSSRIDQVNGNHDLVNEEVGLGVGRRERLGLGDDDEVRTRRVVEALRRTLIGHHSRGRRNEGLRRNRILDWAEILMGLEDHSIEMRLNVPEVDSYIGDPGDYVDAAGYEELLQNLVDSDNGGRRGAPPAAKLVVEGLETRVVGTEEEVVLCAVCKDLVNIGEAGKMLPCGHLYHEECIMPWLGSRNSCPICRFELPTDDPEYEDERKKKINHEKGSSSSGVGVGVHGDHQGEAH